MFKIERNVAPLGKLPSRQGRKPIYPFAEMEIGDSFLVKDQKKAQTARASSWAYGNSHGKKFATRAVRNGIRIWRTA